ncbi:MAG: polysaccharide ABC transporter ATP-binding protein [Cyanobacteria bacterium J06621_3]
MIVVDSLPFYQESDCSNKNEIILSVNNISKKYCRNLKRALLYGVRDIGKELIGKQGETKQLRQDEFWALQDVNFHLRRGGSLGLVGRNGAGKTTLLRLISGLIRPDAGSVMVKGRLAPLIALGAGFDPVLSGRENVYANMSILGLAKREIDEKFDEVIEFAEIKDALDSPVKSYSSGMAARLGFSCAIHVEPDILLIDEVLAVGDIKFRGKCYRKLAELSRKGTSFILVSHNSSAILRICDSAAYLRDGKLQGFSDAHTIIREYEEDLFFINASKADKALNKIEDDQESVTGLSILDVFFRSQKGRVIESPITSQDILLSIKCRTTQKFQDISVTLRINTMDLDAFVDTVIHISSDLDNESFQLEEGTNEIIVELPKLGLNPGNYDAKIGVYKCNSPEILDAVESFVFRVQSSPEIVNLASKNLYYQHRNWRVEKRESAS